VDDPEHRAWLTPVELARYERLRRPEARARFVTGRGLARLTVAEHLGCEPASLVFVSTCRTCGTEHGRPSLPGQDVDFSISHSGELVGLAILPEAGGRRIGLDVEDASPARAARHDELPGLAAIALSEQERRVLDAGADQPVTQRWRDFARYWCRKEAVVKADGAGLALDLRSIVVSAPDAPAEIVAWEGAGVPTLVDVPVPAHAEPRGLALPAAHVAALCVLGEVPCRSMVSSVHRPSTRPAEGIHP